MNNYVLILRSCAAMSRKKTPFGYFEQAARSRPSKEPVPTSMLPSLPLIDYFAVHDVPEIRMNPKPTLLAELIAEFLGTFVLMLFGIGVVAMVVLFPSNHPGETIHGGYTNITLGWGLAVTMGLYISGKVSGGHLNPAVTLTLA